MFDKWAKRTEHMRAVPENCYDRMASVVSKWQIMMIHTVHVLLRRWGVVKTCMSRLRCRVECISKP